MITYQACDPQILPQTKTLKAYKTTLWMLIKLEETCIYLLSTQILFLQGKPIYGKKFKANKTQQISPLAWISDKINLSTFLT